MCHMLLVRAALFTAALCGLAVQLAAHDPTRTSPRRPPAEVFGGGPLELGLGETELKERFGDALVPGRLSLTELPARDLEGTRLSIFYRRIDSPEVAYAEYELFDGRVFRIRWSLTDRFDRPIYSYLLGRTRRRLGEPEADQLVGWAPHTPPADAPLLHYSSWQLGERSLELRQLEPLSGGTVFLTLADERMFLEARIAHNPPVAQPDRMLPFWQRKDSRLKIPTEAERWQLMWTFDDVVVPVAAALSSAAANRDAELGHEHLEPAEAPGS